MCNFFCYRRERETHRRATKQMATTMRTATAAAKVMPTICAIDSPVWRKQQNGLHFFKYSHKRMSQYFFEM